MERNIFVVAERFLSRMVNDYGKHPISTDDGGTWYPLQAKFLELEHYIHSPYEKSIIKRIMLYIKDRTESFNYFLYKKKKCNQACKELVKPVCRLS